MLGQLMIAIQKPDDAGVYCYGSAALFVAGFMFVVPNRCDIHLEIYILYSVVIFASTDPLYGTFYDKTRLVLLSIKIPLFSNSHILQA